MADYNITFPDGSTHTIQSGTINNTYDIPMIAQDAIKYGDDVATAYARLLTNFANTSAPSFGTQRKAGQLWYDTTAVTGGLNVYDGTTWDKLPLDVNVVHVTGSELIAGTKTFSSAPDFTASGSPFTVNSTTVVTNLNAEYLSGNAITALATAAQGVLADNAEPALGNPASNGYVLSSTTGGTRSWVSPAAGTGNIDPADVATAATPASTSILLVDDPTGDQTPLTDSGLTYNATTNTLTTTTFVGNLTGTASLATTATTATTATKATQVTLTDESADTTTFVTFANTATGDQSIHTNTSLTFNSNTGQLGATAFAGSGAALTGLSASNISAGVLAVARGGTGVTTATGTGSAVVLHTSPTFVTSIISPVINNPTGLALQFNATTNIVLQDTTSTGVTSGAAIRSHAAGAANLDIGFNVNAISRLSPGTGFTLTAEDCGHTTLKQGTTAFTITMPNNSNVDFPVGGVHSVVNGGATGDITFADGGETIYYMDGSSPEQDVGASCSMEPGGVATVWRATASIYYIWGSRITA